MTTRVRALLAIPLLGLALGAAMPARADIPDRALDAQLAQLDRFGYNEPEKAAQQLRLLLADPAHASHRLHIEYTLGRNAVQAGRPEDVRRIAGELESRPGGRPLSRMLLAELQDRQGQTGRSGEMAQLAVDELSPACPPASTSTSAVPPGSAGG